MFTTTPLTVCVLLLLIINFSFGQNCLHFDGSSQLVSSNSNALNTIDDGNFTFEAWVKGTPESSAHPIIFSNRIFLNGYQGTKFYFHNYWGGSNSKMLCVQLNAINYLVVSNGTYNGEILDGSCHHVAITRSDDLLTFYVDGLPIGTRTINGAASTASPEDIWIGQDQIVNSTFNGTISNVKIWDIALSEQQVSQSMDCDSLVADNLIAFWKLDEAAGQVVIEQVSGDSDNLGFFPLNESSDPSWSSECCDWTNTSCSSANFNPVVHQVEMPNVFTPNADGFNDVFSTILLDNVAQFKCTILNRWGQKVYETHDPYINWDGQNQPDGTYYYLIDIIDSHGKEQSEHGFFQLIR